MASQTLMNDVQIPASDSSRVIHHPHFVRSKTNQGKVKQAADGAALALPCHKCILRNSCEAVRLMGLGSDFTGTVQVKTGAYKIKKGKHIYMKGDKARSIYIIRSGSLKSYEPNLDADDQILSFHLPGEVLGAEAVVSGKHSSSAAALEDTSVCTVPYTQFSAYDKKIFEKSRWLLTLLSSEIELSQRTVLMLRREKAECRVAGFILALSERFEAHGFSARVFNLSMSRYDIGNYLGLANETVSRVLTCLHSEGILKVSRRQIMIRDYDKLKAIADPDRISCVE